MEIGRLGQLQGRSSPSLGRLAGLAPFPSSFPVQHHRSFPLCSTSRGYQHIGDLTSSAPCAAAYPVLILEISTVTDTKLTDGFSQSPPLSVPSVSEGGIGSDDSTVRQGH